MIYVPAAHVLARAVDPCELSVHTRYYYKM